MVSISGIVRDTVLGQVSSSYTKIFSPLSGVLDLRSHSIQYPRMRNYLWQVKLPEISSDKDLPSGYVPKVMSASIPLPSLATTSQVYQGWTYTYPTNEKVEGMTCDVWADDAGFAVGYYTAWFNSIKNRDGTLNYPIEYEREVPITMYKTDLVSSLSLVVKGVYPISMSPITLSATRTGDTLSTFKINFNVNEVGITGLGSPSLLSSFGNLF